MSRNVDWPAKPIRHFSQKRLCICFQIFADIEDANFTSASNFRGAGCFTTIHGGLSGHIALPYFLLHCSLRCVLACALIHCGLVETWFITWINLTTGIGNLSWVTNRINCTNRIIGNWTILTWGGVLSGDSWIANAIVGLNRESLKTFLQ